jgi:hypothetical protein
MQFEDAMREALLKAGILTETQMIDRDKKIEAQKKVREKAYQKVLSKSKNPFELLVKMKDAGL